MTAAIEFQDHGVWVSNGTRDEMIVYVANRLRDAGREQDAENVLAYLDAMFPGCCIDLADLNGVRLSRDELESLLAQDRSALSPELVDDVQSYMLEVVAILARMVSGKVRKTAEGYFPSVSDLLE